MIRALLLILAGPALAETPALSLATGAETLAIPPADVVDLSGEVFGTRVDVTVRLTAEAAPRLEAFSLAHVGQEVSVLVCDLEIARPRLIEPLSRGALTRGGSGELDKGDEWMIRARPA